MREARRTSGSLLVVVAAALTVAACGPPIRTQCCFTTVSHAATYQASIAAPDGGAPTEVRVFVAANGKTTVTYTQDGHELVEAYDAVPTSP